MKALKILVFFVFVLTGCSGRHLIRTEEELIDHRVFSSWRELESEVVELNGGDFSVNLQVKNIAVVVDNLRRKEVYMNGSVGEGSDFLQSFFGLAVIYLGFQGGCAYAKSGDYYMFPDDEKLMGGCLIFLASCFLGASIVDDGLSKGTEYVKVMPESIKIDTVCVDSVFLSEDEVKVFVEKTDFEKIYYTDKDGNIKLNFEKIIPEVAESDSMFNLIIQYEDLVDSVDVKIKF